MASKGSNIHILQWNVMGLKSKLPEVSAFLTAHNVPIAAFVETFIPKGRVAKIPHYSCHQTCRTQSRGGVAIYVHETIPHTPLSITVTDHRLEIVAVQVRLFNRTFSLVNVYNPGHFIASGDLIPILKHFPAPIIVCGDFNSHNTKWGCASTNPRGAHLEEAIEHLNFIILNDGSCTRHQPPAVDSAIDLTFVSPNLAAQLHWMTYFDKAGSDHFPIHISFLHHTINLHRRTVKVIDHRLLSKHLSHPPKVYNDTRDVHYFITDAVSKSSYLVNRKFPPNPPWFNTECKQSVALRKRAQRKAKASRRLDDIIECRRQTALTRKVIKTCKSDYWKDYCSNLPPKAPGGKLWKQIRSMAHCPAANPSWLALTVSQSSTDVANAFLEHFFPPYNSPSNTSHRRMAEVVSHYFEYMPTASDKDYDSDFTISDLNSALKASRQGAPGPDNITFKCLKLLPNEGLSGLLHMFNQSWSTGHIPREWKNGLVIPIHKPGQPANLLSAYRPITLISCVAKLLERMVQNRLSHKILTLNLFSSCQTGFRKHNSTADNICHLVSCVKQAFIKKEFLIAVLFDIKGAFDSVWHSGLLYKMHKAGIQGNLFYWLKNYLAERDVAIRLGNSISRSTFLKCGVPQGSVLGPTLFNIMMSDVGDVLPHNVSISTYADDIAIWASDRNLQYVTCLVQSAVDKICTWFDTWGFSASETKTMVIPFTRRRLPSNSPTISLKGKPLAIVSQARYLGVVLDSKLTWKPHIEQLTSTCSRHIGILRCLSSTKWGASTDTLLNVYRATIKSRLAYVAQAYMGAAKTHLQKIEQIQSRSLKVCLGSIRGTPCNALQVEAFDPPVHLMQIKTTLQQFIRLALFHPSHPLLQSFRNDNHYSYLHHIISNDIPGAGLFLPAILDYPNPPPMLSFTGPPTDIHYSIGNTASKNNTPIDVLHNLAMSIISDKWEGFLHVFTDGSKNDHGAAAAFSIPSLKVTEACRLPKHSSIMTCEVIALICALHWIRDNKISKSVIFCDSKPALDFIQIFPSSFPNLQITFFEALRTLYNYGALVSFQWIPSHCKIPGNDNADCAAKYAISHNFPTLYIRPSYNECLYHIRTYLRTLWQAEWDDTSRNKGSHRYSVQPFICPRNTPCLKRPIETAVNRLRLGHCGLNKKLHQLNVVNSPLCSQCKTDETVEHILLHCRKYSEARKKLFNCPESCTSSITVPMLLNTSNRQQIHRLSDFLVDTKLIDRI